MNRANSHNDFGHDEHTIKIVEVLLLLLLNGGTLCLQSFDTVGWSSGRASSLKKIKWWGLVWLSVESEMQIVCIWSSWCHCIPKSPSSVVSFKQETVSGSGISWAIWKSAPRSRQIITPAPHHSVNFWNTAFKNTRVEWQAYYKQAKCNTLHPSGGVSIADWLCQKCKSVYEIRHN